MRRAFFLDTTFMQPHPIPEWHKQFAVLLTWPHAHSDWHDILPDIEQTYQTIALCIAEYQTVIVLCYDKTHQIYVQKCLKHHSNIHCIVIPTNDTWIRDYGPITIASSQQSHCCNFQFNAWGNKFPYRKDNDVNAQLAELGLFANYRFHDIGFVLEGGAIETNGEIMMTTTPCALDPKRNPNISDKTFSNHMRTHLGVKSVIFLQHGHLLGDDTDGHIDTIVRFCNKETLCYVQTSDTTHPNAKSLQALEVELQTLPFTKLPLPNPPIIKNQAGRPLPATYANFLITNEKVLVPTYAVPTDDKALALLRNYFPKHQIQGIDCRALIEHNGSLHCATMQIPA